MPPTLQRLLKSIAYRCGFSLRRLRRARSVEVAEGDGDRRIRPLLHQIDPYQGFDWQGRPDDASGWGSDSPAFGELIAERRPRRIIEIGTWKGGSALEMATHLEKAGLKTEIICVDT